MSELEKRLGQGRIFPKADWANLNRKSLRAAYLEGRPFVPRVRTDKRKEGVAGRKAGELTNVNRKEKKKKKEIAKRKQHT